MQTVSEVRAFEGSQGVYSHYSSVCDCTMTFSVFLPPQAQDRKCPVLWYLSGLVCTHANVMEKGEFRRAAAEHGIIIVCPDTSPRGENIPDVEGNWQAGTGAGFYLDATEAPFAENYQMASYVTQELPELVAQNFAVDMDRQGIFGHSMGGHGALTLALKNPELYRSCSAFAPIVNPTSADWSQTAFEKYLGPDRGNWRGNDACALIEDGKRFSGFLVDQGTADEFLDPGLRPWLLEQACKDAAIPLTLRMQDGYDHSYYFVSTFMHDHIAWHAARMEPNG